MKPARTRQFLILVLGTTIPGAARADAWAMPTIRTVESRSHRYSVTIIPNLLPLPGTGFHSIARLKSHDGTKQKTLWTKPLQNVLAPYIVMVADSGRCVVTMGDWGCPDKLPLVIYNKKGNLIRKYELADLDISDVELLLNQHMAPKAWLRRALPFFFDNDHLFIIRLKWGRYVLIDPKTGDVMRFHEGASIKLSSGQIASYQEMTALLDAESRLRAEELLDSDDTDDLLTGCELAGHYRMRTASEKLKRLLNNHTRWTALRGDKMEIIFPVREAAAKALRLIAEHNVNTRGAGERAGR